MWRTRKTWNIARYEIANKTPEDALHKIKYDKKFEKTENVEFD